MLGLGRERVVGIELVRRRWQKLPVERKEREQTLRLNKIRLKEKALNPVVEKGRGGGRGEG
jgi:hypothetical protein